MKYDIRGGHSSLLPTCHHRAVNRLGPVSRLNLRRVQAVWMSKTYMQICVRIGYTEVSEVAFIRPADVYVEGVLFYCRALWTLRLICKTDELRLVYRLSLVLSGTGISWTPASNFYGQGSSSTKVGLDFRPRCQVWGALAKDRKYKTTTGSTDDWPVSFSTNLVQFERSHSSPITLQGRTKSSPKTGEGICWSS